MRNILEQHNLCMERVCTSNQTGLQTQRTKNHTNAMQEHRFDTMFTNPSFAGCLADELCIALNFDWIERVRSHRQTNFNIEITCSPNSNSQCFSCKSTYKHTHIYMCTVRPPYNEFKFTEWKCDMIYGWFSLQFSTLFSTWFQFLLSNIRSVSNRFAWRSLWLGWSLKKHIHLR